jgi:hypothetical protein
LFAASKMLSKNHNIAAKKAVGEKAAKQSGKAATKNGVKASFSKLLKALSVKNKPETWTLEECKEDCAAQVQDNGTKRSVAGAGREEGEGCKCDAHNCADRRCQYREPIHSKLGLLSMLGFFSDHGGATL